MDEVGLNLSMGSKKGRYVINKITIFKCFSLRSVKGVYQVLNVPLIRSKNYSVCAIYSKNKIEYHNIENGNYNWVKFKIFL